MRKSDSGAALALVIFFITILALWMGAVAFFTQTSGAAITANTRLSELRAQKITSTLQQAIVALTDNSKGQDGRFGMDFDGRRCDQSGSPLPATFNSTISGRTYTIRVTCTQRTFSGYQFPLASFMLTGSSCATAPCVTGQDGGLKITNPSANDCVTATSNSTPRIQVSGGLLNVSGAWKGVSCANIELIQNGENPPVITQPDPDASISSCPAATASLNFDSDAQCACPSWFPQNGKDWCPSGNLFADINPADSQSYNNAFIQNVVSGLGSASGTASIAGSCGAVGTDPVTKKPIYDVTSNSWGFSVNVLPGVVNQTVLNRLNTLLTSSSCGDGSTIDKPAIWFTPGIYRFDLGNGNGVAKVNSGGGSWNTLFINNNATKVVAGAATSASTCDTTRPGVEFQFVGSTYFDLTRGSFTICPYRVSRGEIGVTFAALPSWASTNIWNGARTSPFMYIAKGQSAAGGAAAQPVTFRSEGMVLAPGGWADVNAGGTTTAVFANGAVFRALSLTVNGSAQTSPTLNPPPPFNGDRIVQLRLWDLTPGLSDKSRDLGLVQLIIKDYFSKKPGYGFKIVTWRTMW